MGTFCSNVMMLAVSTISSSIRNDKHFLMGSLLLQGIIHLLMKGLHDGIVDVAGGTTVVCILLYMASCGQINGLVCNTLIRYMACDCHILQNRR